MASSMKRRMTRHAPYRTKEYGREELPSLEKDDGFEDIMMVPVQESGNKDTKRTTLVTSTGASGGSNAAGNPDTVTGTPTSIRESLSSSFLDDSLPPPLSDDEQLPPVEKDQQRKPDEKQTVQETGNKNSDDETSDNSTPQDLSKPDAIVTERKCLYRDYPHLKRSQFRRNSMSDAPMRRLSSTGTTTNNAVNNIGSKSAGVKPRNARMRRASVAGSTLTTAVCLPLQQPLSSNATDTMPSYSQSHLNEKEVEAMEENYAVMNMLSAMGNASDFAHPLHQDATTFTEDSNHSNNGTTNSSRSRRGSLVEGISALAEKMPWNNDYSDRSRRKSMNNAISSDPAGQEAGSASQLRRYLGADQTTASQKVNATLLQQNHVSSPRSRSPPLAGINNNRNNNKDKHRPEMMSRMMNDSASSSNRNIITNMLEMDDIRLSTHHRRGSLQHHFSSGVMPEDDTSDLTSAISEGADDCGDDRALVQSNIRVVDASWISDVHDIAERVDRKMFILGAESPFIPIPEVIPAFGDIHRKMKSHLIRYKVREIKEKRGIPLREYIEESVMDTGEVHLSPDIVPIQRGNGVKNGLKNKHQQYQQQHRLTSIASAVLRRHSLNRFLDDQAFVGKYLYRKRKTTPSQFEGYILPVVIAMGLERRLDDQSCSIMAAVLEDMDKESVGYQQSVLHSDILTKFRRQLSKDRSRKVRTSLFENPIYDNRGIPEVAIASVDETKGIEHRRWLISQWNLLLADGDDEEKYEYKLYSSGEDRQEYSPDEHDDNSSSGSSISLQNEESICSSDDESDELQDLPSFANREDETNQQQMRPNLHHLGEESDSDSDGSEEFPWWQSPPTENPSTSPPTKAQSLTLMDDDDSSSDGDEYPWSNYIPPENDEATMGIVEQTRKNLSDMKIGRMIQNQDQETKVALDKMSSHNRTGSASAHGRSIMEFFSSHKRATNVSNLESSERVDRRTSSGNLDLRGSQSLHNRSSRSYHARRDSRESTMAMHNSMHQSMHSNRRDFRTNPSFGMSSNNNGLNRSTHQSHKRSKSGSQHQRKGAGLENRSFHSGTSRTKKHLIGSTGGSAHERIRRNSIEEYSASINSIDWLSDNNEDDDEADMVGSRRMSRYISSEAQALEVSYSNLSPEKEGLTEKRRGSLYEGPP